MKDQDIARNATYKGNDYTGRRLTMAEYERCQFVDCELGRADLAGIKFDSCTFRGCNLGLVNLEGAALREVEFIDCKLIGVDFSVCNALRFEVQFTGCILDFAYMVGGKLRGTRFDRCSIVEANFTEADLRQAVFADCDLYKTIWNHTQLRGADLRSARRYSIDPENNLIREAKFSYPDVLGLLDKYGIDVE